MLHSEVLSVSRMKKEIVTFAILNCVLYIVFLLSFKYLNLLHVYGLRMINYLVFGVLSVIEIRRLVKLYGAPIPFLQSFFLILCTGALSFFLLGVFLLLYSFVDPMLNPFYATHYNGIRLVPSVFIFFEGTGASIIIGLISMLYASQFESGEKSV